MDTGEEEGEVTESEEALRMVKSPNPLAVDICAARKLIRRWKKTEKLAAQASLDCNWGREQQELEV